MLIKASLMTGFFVSGICPLHIKMAAESAAILFGYFVVGFTLLSIHLAEADPRSYCPLSSGLDAG